MNKPPPISRAEIRQANESCRAYARHQVWDYGGRDYYDRTQKRGATKRRLCPPCLDNHGRKREIPQDSVTGMCRMCYIERERIDGRRSQCAR